jgi:hypothetical protein
MALWFLTVDQGDDGESWTRGEWARWYLDHDDAGAAAEQLDDGDDLALEESAFPDLARALHRRGLAALYEDGWAYVHTPAGALTVLAEIERDAVASGGRLPPARSPAPAEMRRPAIRAAKAPSRTAGGRGYQSAG